VVFLFMACSLRCEPRRIALRRVSHPAAPPIGLSIKAPQLRAHGARHTLD